jgi:endo-1,4-beta-mannosidase
MNAERQRDKALSILNSRLTQLSKLYKECYLSSGRGALIVYASDVIEKGIPKEYDYRTKEEMLEVFDMPSSQATLSEMIGKYSQKKEGIMALITDYSNATYFITFKLS